MTHRIFILAALLLLFGSAAVQAQTVVVVNASVDARDMSVEELRDVFTLNKTHWDDGTRISVFDLKAGRPKQDLYTHIDMSETSLQRIWLRKQFTGTARPPKALGSEEALLDMVAKTAGAIGYASARAAAGRKNIRIVSRLRKEEQ